jgi:hypothetical protein
LTGAFGLTFGFDYAQEQKNKNSNTYFHLFSPVGIIRITNKHWALSVRGEYYNDPNGILIFTGSPDGFKTIGLSANIDYLPKENVMLRLEGKTYNSKDNIFIKNNLPVNSNTAITISTSIAF